MRAPRLVTATVLLSFFPAFGLFGVTFRPRSATTVGAADAVLDAVGVLGAAGAGLGAGAGVPGGEGAGGFGVVGTGVVGAGEGAGAGGGGGGGAGAGGTPSVLVPNVCAQ